MATQRPAPGRPQRDPQVMAIIDLLRTFSLEMERYIGIHGGRHGLHRTDLNALGHIMEASQAGADLAPGELAAALGLSAPATSALLARLERVGHVRRIHDQGDRRRVSIEMTEDAERVGTAVFGPVGGAVAAAVGRYSTDERAIVSRFLADVVAAVAEASATDPALAAPRGAGTTSDRPAQGKLD